MRLLAAAFFLVMTTSLSAQTPQRSDLIIADFEGTDYGAWTVSGKAFGTAPSQGAKLGQKPLTGFQGHGLASSLGNNGEGELQSPEFTLARDYINFLIGGGQLPGQAFLALMVDGKVVRGATGTKSHALTWANWEVKDLQGKKARLRIVDRAIEHYWGYISVDQIVQSDVAQGSTLTDATVAKEWVISNTELYNESFRPQFHFSAKDRFINDPNGLVFYQNEYHLCFQHHDRVGLSWGHAVSPDLLHWQQLTNAIEPDTMGEIGRAHV